MIENKDIIHKAIEDGNSIPSFTNKIAEVGTTTLTADLFLTEEYPVVLFCIYIDGKGDFASNTLDAAVDEFNRLTQ